MTRSIDLTKLFEEFSSEFIGYHQSWEEQWDDLWEHLGYLIDHDLGGKCFPAKNSRGEIIPRTCHHCEAWALHRIKEIASR